MDIFTTDAYTREQLVYTWRENDGRPIATARDLQLSQYQLVAFPTSTANVTSKFGIYCRFRFQVWSPFD